jgi:AraC-like DNA-binding protein
MNGIYKFERETVLNGENIHIRKDVGSSGFRKHWHNYYEIIIYMSSNGVCNLNGTDYEIKDRTLFLLTPKDFHQIFLDGNSASSCIVIAFTENAVDTSLIDRLTENAMVVYAVSDSITELAYMMLGAFESDSRYRRQQLEHLLNSLLVEVLNCGICAGQGSSELNPVVRSAVSYVITNPSEDLTLEAVSGMFGLSPSYFSTLFRQSTGITYKKYVTSIRIDYAKRLLEDGKMSVLEVGLECGFNTPSQFIRAFRDMTGETPSGFRTRKRRL